MVFDLVKACGTVRSNEEQLEHHNEEQLEHHDTNNEPLPLRLHGYISSQEQDSKFIIHNINNGGLSYHAP